MDFAQYANGLAGLMVLVLIQMLLSPLTGFAKGKAGLAPGGEPAADYASPTYRIHRLYGNTAENLAPIAVAVLAAMAVGVPALTVAVLVWVHVAARIAYSVILHRGIGRPHQGIRTAAYVIGWGANVLLALAVLWTVVF